MTQRLEIFSSHNWSTQVEDSQKKFAVHALETGKVLFFPELKFVLNAAELNYLLQASVTERTKNISYDFLQDGMRGSCDQPNVQHELKKIMRRFAEASQALIASYLPGYVDQLQIGRTSLRPVEIAGRKAPSYRKDDTRLHVDAFPANPNQGRRILRVFYNYNPDGKTRVWRLGDAFANVAKHFFPDIKKPLFGSRRLLQLLKITKSQRTAYDHYMLHLHDNMKYDLDYQRTVAADTIEFPALSAWIVYTDSVSHAAMSGQHLLEQTFYLPVSAMANAELAPLRVLEGLAGKKLV